MPFASLSDFDKWHKSIQNRYNAGAQTGLPSPGGRTKAVAQHIRAVLPRPYDSQLRKQTGATLPPFARCDITTGPRLTKAQGDSTPLQRSGPKALGPPEPTPSKEAEE